VEWISNGFFSNLWWVWKVPLKMVSLIICCYIMENVYLILQLIVVKSIILCLCASYVIKNDIDFQWIFLKFFDGFNNAISLLIHLYYIKNTFKYHLIIILQVIMLNAQYKCICIKNHIGYKWIFHNLFMFWKPVPCQRWYDRQSIFIP